MEDDRPSSLLDRPQLIDLPRGRRQGQLGGLERPRISIQVSVPCSMGAVQRSDLEPDCQTIPGQTTRD